MTESFVSRNGLSLSTAVGLPSYTFRRLLLLTSCILGVFQYGMVLTNGISVQDFNDYYGLTSKEGDFLYSCLNFGACALSFIPGLCYDRFGCIWSMVVGTLVADAGLVLQMLWTPSSPAFLSTMNGLALCYICFGFASTFFNVIGSFAPLVAFPEKDVGKISACVQVCMSLGITLQTEAYYALKGLGGDCVQNYLLYALISFNVSGIVMCLVFWACRNLLVQAPQNDSQHSTAAPARSLGSCIRTQEFMFMFLLFFIAIGFSFSFLNCEGRIAAEAGVSEKAINTAFGVLNAIGRLAVSIPLDYTRHHPLGGVYAYISVSLLCFVTGILVLVVPSEADRGLVHIANTFISLGYGGLLGILPPALRIFFGTDHLGVIYGILYIAVALSEPLWSLLFSKPVGCHGVGCYSSYLWMCAAGFALTIVVSFAMLRKEVKRHLTNSSCPEVLIETTNFS